MICGCRQVGVFRFRALELGSSGNGSVLENEESSSSVEDPRRILDVRLVEFKGVVLCAVTPHLMEHDGRRHNPGKDANSHFVLRSAIY